MPGGVGEVVYGMLTIIDNAKNMRVLSWAGYMINSAAAYD